METNKTAKNPDELPLSPEEIKAIGEIELGPAKHEVFLNKHYKKLIYGGIALLLAASLAVSYYSYKNQQEQEAGALIVQATGAATSSGARTPEAYEAKALAEVGERYSETSSYPVAGLMEALSLLADPAHAERGIAQLEGMANDSMNDLIRVRAAASLAAYYMRERKDDKAVEYWQKVVAMPLNPYTAIAYVNLGDLSKNAGDIETARNYYQQVSASTPNSPLAAEGIVGLREALLEVDAPREVQAQPKPAPSPSFMPQDNQQNPFGGFSTLSGSSN